MIYTYSLSRFFELPACRLLFAGMLIVFLSACQNRSPVGNTDISDNNATEANILPDTADAPPQVGGQKDEHGCLIAAGYIWSQVKQECVRIFESGIRLNPQDANLDQTTSAFIIFNDDQTTVELFLPAQKGSLLLERTGIEGNYQWKNGEYALSVWKGYLLKAGEKTLYHGE
jgi:hypothetical protein